jgi:carbon dioxide concentrating mechanism protein CcmN
MHLPPLQPPIAAGYCISGTVVIAPDAIVAAGVVLMADPNSQITIGAGACLGLGVILHANGGGIAIEAGAILGAGVLIIGTAVIGRGAAIGASTTIYNSSVASHQIVAAGTLLGERERSVSTNAGFSEANGSNPAVPDPWSSASGQSSNQTQASNRPASQPASAADQPDLAQSDSVSQPDRPKKPAVVYGKDAFLQMRGAMFPS